MCKLNDNRVYGTKAGDRCSICGIKRETLWTLEKYQIFNDMDNVPYPKLEECVSSIADKLNNERLFLCSNCEEAIKQSIFDDMFHSYKTTEKIFRGYKINIFGKKIYSDDFCLDEYMSKLIAELKPELTEKAYDYRYVACVHERIEAIIDKLTKARTMLCTETELTKAFNKAINEKLFEMSWNHPVYPQEDVVFTSVVEIDQENDTDTIGSIMRDGGCPLSIETMQERYPNDKIDDVGFKMMHIHVVPKIQFQNYEFDKYILVEVRGVELAKCKKTAITVKKKPINPPKDDDFNGNITGGFKID